MPGSSTVEYRPGPCCCARRGRHRPGTGPCAPVVLRVLEPLTQGNAEKPPTAYEASGDIPLAELGIAYCRQNAVLTGRPDNNLSGLSGAVRLRPVFAFVASRSLTGDSRSPCYFQRSTRSERTPVIDERMAVSGFRHADAPEYDDVVAAAH